MLAQSARFHRILMREVTTSNSDRLLKERDAFVITILNKHICYCSRITLIVHKVVWNVKNPDTVFHTFGEPALDEQSLGTSVEQLSFMF